MPGLIDIGALAAAVAGIGPDEIGIECDCAAGAASDVAWAAACCAGCPRQTGLRHISNRSRARRNGNWKMASRDWLDKATSRHLKFQNVPARRLRRASLTRGNDRGSHTHGNRIVKTALAGWGGRIRTLGSREAASRAWLDRDGGAIDAAYSLQNGPNGLDWGASHSLAAQPGKVSDRQTLRNEGKFGPYFKSQFWKRHL